MVIQARLVTEGNAIQADIDSLNALNQIVSEAGQKVLDRIAPDALSEMRHYPPPAKLPFQFGSERSRNYYFVLVRKGLVPTSNGRYARTGGLANSMFFTGKAEQGRFTFTAGSRSRIAKYVVDSFDRSRRNQVAGHINTGWPLLRDTVNFWLDAADEEMKREIDSIYIVYRSGRKNR